MISYAELESSSMVAFSILANSFPAFFNDVVGVVEGVEEAEEADAEASLAAEWRAFSSCIALFSASERSWFCSITALRGATTNINSETGSFFTNFLRSPPALPESVGERGMMLFKAFKVGLDFT